MSLDEHQLIKSAQRGDVEAFSALTAQFERRIYVLALHYTRDQHDAEDLVQDVWLKAFRSLNGFRGDASFYTWLRHIMINTFLNHRRSDSARSRIVESLSFDESETATERLAVTSRHAATAVEQDYERKVLVDAVMQVLEQLTPQQRLVFLLKHREGMTYAEISLALGCSIGTVKKSLARVVSRMRGQFGVNETPVEFAHCDHGRTN